MGNVKPKKAQAMIDEVLAVADLLGEELREVNRELTEQILADVKGNIKRVKN